MTAPTPPVMVDPTRNPLAPTATGAPAPAANGAASPTTSAAAAAATNGYTGIDNGAPLTAVDTDHDGLTDDFEKLAGTNPLAPDTDADGLTDAFEALRSHTDPLAPDTDHDGIADAAEVAAGSDAGTIPGIAGVSGLGDHAQNVRAGVLDSDLDGLTDPYEMQHRQQSHGCRHRPRRPGRQLRSDHRHQSDDVGFRPRRPDRRHGDPPTARTRST